MSVSKDVIKQCLISKQREMDGSVIVNRPWEGIIAKSLIFTYKITKSLSLL